MRTVWSALVSVLLVVSISAGTTTISAAEATVPSVNGGIAGEAHR